MSKNDIYRDGLNRGQLAGEICGNADEARMMRLSLSWHELNASDIIGGEYVATERDFYRGLRRGLLLAERAIRQATAHTNYIRAIRRLAARDQEDAHRRATKPPCMDCGKPTICKDHCRFCAAKARIAADSGVRQT